MNYWQIILISLIQGTTEFIPVSSSAHLLLVPPLFGLPEQGLLLDVAVHMGTLAALFLYYRKDLLQLAIGTTQFLQTRKYTSESTLVGHLILATLPIVITGYYMHENIVAWRTPHCIAYTTLGFGGMLGLAALIAPMITPKPLTWRTGLLIGLAQILALIPGTSRSGITLTACLLSGLQPRVAARFAFLLGIPVILAAVVLTFYKAPVVQAWQPLCLAFVLTLGIGYSVISVFMKILDKFGVMPWVYYRLLLGGLMCWLLL